MATNYPGGLDTTSSLRDNFLDDTVTAAVHATAHNNVADAILAIETELGIDPKGSYATVAAALSDALVKTPVASQIVTPTGDFVALAVKSSGTQNIANLFEARDHLDNTLAFIDRTGLLNAHALSIQGSPLALANLSDAAMVALLASPAFTGAPTAPTAVAGTSTTQIATTEFVLANGVPTGTVMPYAGGTAPNGYLIANGAEISRTTYANLFAVIGTTHGAGNGTTTFNLPDLQSRMVVGKGVSTDTSTLGAHDNVVAASRTFKHYHGVGTLAISAHSINDGGHHHDYTNPGNNLGTGSSGGVSGPNSTQQTSTEHSNISIANHTVSGNIGTTTGVSETPAYIVLNYIIKT